MDNLMLRGHKHSISRPTNGPQRSSQQHSTYQIPASALYESAEVPGASGSSVQALSVGGALKAAHEEKLRQPKHSKDEMPPPASPSQPCNDAAAQKAAKEAAERAKIQADNVGHRLLSKMGWKEGEGPGELQEGYSDPIMAGNVKKDNLGVGAVQPGEVTPEDDIYEQYKKRMMLGYVTDPILW
ncbi:G-patch domain [Sesbania bispinosa]|nr:G-patch domain [Sesbania bispinosa]